jgi:hypothetical protein
VSGTYNSKVHEAAIECVAKRIASFRLGLDADDPYAYNDHEMLEAGYIVGSLWAQGLLTEAINLPAPPVEAKSDLDQGKATGSRPGEKVTPASESAAKEVKS